MLDCASSSTAEMKSTQKVAAPKAGKNRYWAEAASAKSKIARNHDDNRETAAMKAGRDWTEPDIAGASSKSTKLVA